MTSRSELAMGWGTDEHEGLADGKRTDGTFTNGSWRGPQDDPVALIAKCSCGWRSDVEHEIGPRPSGDQTALDAWHDRQENAEEACRAEWDSEHFESLLGYEPEMMLIEARDEGGRRHFLNGRAVHAGSTLELLLPGGRWIPIRYEWDWTPHGRARAHLLLGGPPQAERQYVTPAVEFTLPARAVLRWPQGDSS